MRPLIGFSAVCLALMIDPVPAEFGETWAVGPRAAQAVPLMPDRLPPVTPEEVLIDDPVLGACVPEALTQAMFDLGLGGKGKGGQAPLACLPAPCQSVLSYAQFVTHVMRKEIFALRFYDMETAYIGDYEAFLEAQRVYCWPEGEPALPTVVTADAGVPPTDLAFWDEFLTTTGLVPRPVSGTDPATVPTAGTTSDPGGTDTILPPLAVPPLVGSSSPEVVTSGSSISEGGDVASETDTPDTTISDTTITGDTSTGDSGDPVTVDLGPTAPPVTSPETPPVTPPAVVPLPAPGLLLMGALVALGLRRRLS